jgi:hypothetical protein
MVSELFFLFFVPLRPPSPNLPKWEKRCSKNWSLSELPLLSLSLSLSLWPETKEKIFAAASAALTSSVLQQN